MKNLAGVKTADDDIRRELERARIPIKVVEQSDGEVPFTLVGMLGRFVFRRAWVYWVVKGLVPIAVARELYADPVGVTDVRVAGHCGCPPPDEWANWLTPDGKIVRPSADETEYRRLVALNQADTNSYLFSNDPASLGAEQFVTTYHIDSEVGLRLFVDTLLAHNLAS